MHRVEPDPVHEVGHVEEWPVLLAVGDDSGCEVRPDIADVGEPEPHRESAVAAVVIAVEVRGAVEHRHGGLLEVEAIGRAGGRGGAMGSRSDPRPQRRRSLRLRPIAQLFQPSIRQGELDVGPQHLHAVAACVGDEGCGRVEPHRLGPQ